MYFHKMVEHYKQRLEEPVDTPDEVLAMLWYVKTYNTALEQHRAEYERMRKEFSPKDELVEALDKLIKECGANHETA